MQSHILSYFSIHTGNFLQTNVKIHPPPTQTSSLHYTYSFLKSLDTRPTEHLQETKHFNTYCELSDPLTFMKVLKSSHIISMALLTSNALYIQIFLNSLIFIFV